MPAALRATVPESDHGQDQFLWFDRVSWQDYERLLRMRGDHSAPRITYLKGRVEIMSPSRDHEAIKSWIGGLVEAWCFHHEVVFSSYGSWTLKDGRRKRGVEPDECYVFGHTRVARPHLAIEVVWSRGDIDKLEVYRKLGVGEIWIWEDGAIRIHGLRGEEYAPLAESAVLPGIDLVQLVSFLDLPTMYDAIRGYRAALAGA
jgi:Uma2 family endonuclease